MFAHSTRALAIILSVLAAGTTLPAKPLEYLVLAKSQPVEVNGLQFVVATQSQWCGRAGGTMWPVEIQLLITNKSGDDLVFRTFDTFAPKLKSADGKEIPFGGERDGTTASSSVLIQAGDTYCLARKAELWWKLRGPTSADIPDDKGGTIHWTWQPTNHLNGFGLNPDGRCGLLYWDGTGAIDYYQPLNPGSYRLRFSVGSGEKEAARETQKLGGLKVWSGTVETKAASLEIIEEPN